MRHPADTFALSTPSECELRVTREFNAPRRLVFEAFTNPALVPRWLTGPGGWTMPICEIDFRVGGHFRYAWQKAGGPQMAMGGHYLEIVAPERIVHAELFDQDWTGGETRVTTVFDEHGGVTTVTMTVRYGSQAARDGALTTGMAKGMAAGYEQLDALLATQA